VTADRVERRRWLSLSLLCVAQFVDVLGVTIVVVALPSIRDDVGLSNGGLQWVVSAYALFFGGFLIVSGRAADLYGRRRLFASGLALFGLASLCCGLSTSAISLIAARAVQGLGSALVVPAALSMLTTIFVEPAERSRALAVWTAAAAGGGAAGFVVGGVITSGLGWEWVFLVNVPVAAAALVVTPRVLAESRGESSARHLDLTGALAVTGGLVALILALTRVDRAGISDLGTLSALAASVLLLAGFVVAEGRAAEPLVSAAVLRARGLLAANATAFALTAVTSSAAVLGTVYGQRVLDLDPATMGLALLPFSLAVIAGSALSPWFGRRLGARGVMTMGLVLVAVAMLLGSRIDADGGLGFLLGSLSLSGVGLGAAAVASTGLGTGAVAADRQGIASGLLNTSTQLGTAVGVALFTSVAAARTHALAGLDPSDAELVAGFRFAYLAAAAFAAGVAAALAWRTGAIRRARSASGEL
jgi:EmrB/QacA subfamily drug resistance transporter